MKKMIKWMILALVSLVLVSCSTTSKKASENQDNNVVVGFYIGPYRDHFTEGIQPLLEAQGYHITIKDFTDPVVAATALKENEIAASFSMSTAYADGFNTDHGSNFVRATYTTSAPQALYSQKHTSLEQVQDGMTVGVPNDPVNEERAFRILEELGWVKLAKNTDTLNFTLNDVTSGEVNLNFKEIDSTQLASSLQDLDYAIINGNIAIDAGYNIGKDSLLVENTPDQHRLVMVVNKENEKNLG